MVLFYNGILRFQVSMSMHKIHLPHQDGRIIYLHQDGDSEKNFHDILKAKHNAREQLG